jgi:hypothetical protein
MNIAFLVALVAAEATASPGKLPSGPSKGPEPPAMSSARPSRAALDAKLSPAVSKEMTESIVAVNKALGLESWTMRGAKPCVDRGGHGITAKDVSAEDTRKCAMTAIEKGFPELGKSFVLAIPMTEVGPVTVLALGIGGSDGWAAYSCDPERKCAPVKIGAPSKWGKRMAERQAKACSEATTLWFPADQRVCPGAPAPAPSPPTAAK